MIIYTTTQNPAVILMKMSKEWKIDGNSGITYYALVSNGDDAEKVKVLDKDIWESLPVGEPVHLDGNISYFNGKAGDYKISGFRLK